MPKKQQRIKVPGGKPAAGKGSSGWEIRDRAGRLGSSRDFEPAGSVTKDEVFEEILVLAARVIGSREAAERWLGTRVPALDGARPKELLRTSEGTARVREALHQIEHGIFA